LRDSKMLMGNLTWKKVPRSKQDPRLWSHNGTAGREPARVRR
jgi:hypothetical protein